MPSIKDSFAIKLRGPVLTLVLTATAIPVAFRSFGSEPLSFKVGFWDVLANVLGYLPVGVVLAELGLVRALIGAAMLTTYAEFSQSVMVHRAPSGVDVLTNLSGAALGVYLCRRWRIPAPVLRMNRFRAVAAAVMGFALLLGMWARSGATPNVRGMTEPGTLEAHWTFDEGEGSGVMDSSGHGLTGTYKGHPERVAGILGGAVRFDGAHDYIDLGQSSELRLVGSMTLTAWINSSAFPRDDAAIVSSLNDVGYQLDTTVDTGPRTIGFKLSDSCGKMMARYGASALTLDTWYHVAGVYDAESRALNVYLDGELDNGSLLGVVPGRQHASREAVCIGRRSRPSGFEFAGAIDDVRIYSVALTGPQIEKIMRGEAIDISEEQHAFQPAAHGARPANLAPNAKAECISFPDPEDATLPGAAGVLGVLVAAACSGLWPSKGPIAPLIASLAIGSLLLTATSSELPSFNLLLIPLTSLAGAVSVVTARLSTVQKL